MEQSGQGIRFLLLTGAPRSEDLSWTDSDLTVELQPCFRQSNDSTIRPVYKSSNPPSWRELHLNPRSFHSGFSQQHFPLFYRGLNPPTSENGSRDGFRSTITEDTAEGAMNDSFLTKSLSLSAVESFWSASSGYSQIADPSLFWTRTTNLSDLPKAHQLVHPPRHGQGLINLLVVVLSVSPPQIILTKRARNNEEAELTRLSVADDTCTDFELSLWLDHKDKTMFKNDRLAVENESLLRKAIEDLQTHDIALFQNMIPRIFQNRVSASSVRGLTSINLLYRDRLPLGLDHNPWYSTFKFVNSETNGSVPDKIIKILKWRDKFLEAPVANDAESEGHKNEKDDQPRAAGKTNIQLPLDTQ